MQHGQAVWTNGEAEVGVRGRAGAGTCRPAQGSGVTMALTRRDLVKAGVFAGAALSLPLSESSSGQSALDNRMPTSKLPKPFTMPFVRSAGRGPGAHATTRPTTTA